MAILDLFRLDGEIAVVTGGGGGIGRGIALGLAEAGADVVLAGRRVEKIEAVAEEVRSRGRRALAVATDVTKADQIDRLVTAALAEFGKITTWVSNAGGAQEAKLDFLARTTEESWDRITTLNFKAVWLCAKAAHDVLPPGGSLINVSSRGAFTDGAPFNGVYTASKAAVNHLTKTMALEFSRRGIRVNAIAPGAVETEDFYDASGFTREQFEQMAARQPLKRLGNDEDFGAAAVYLASKASSWVTGSVLIVAGGP